MLANIYGVKNISELNTDYDIPKFLNEIDFLSKKNIEL